MQKTLRAATRDAMKFLMFSKYYGKNNNPSGIKFNLTIGGDIECSKIIVRLLGNKGSRVATTEQRRDIERLFIDLTIPIAVRCGIECLYHRGLSTGL